MSSTAPPRALLPKGGWVCGSFVGPYEAVAQRERPDALVLDARVLGLVMLPGHVKGLRPSRAPALRADRPPLTQRELEVLAELHAEVPREPAKAGAPPPAPLPVVHRLTLRDVFLCDWSAEPLADEVQAARGLVRGTLFARVGPEPWSLWRWLWLLLLLLLLLFLFLMFARCAPLEPVAAPLRQRVVHGVENLRWRVLERFAADPDAELLAEATRGTGRGGGGVGGAGGTGAAGTGAGGKGAAGTGAAGTGAAGTGAAGTGAAGTGAAGTGAAGTGAAGTGAAGTGEGGTGAAGTGAAGAGAAGAGAAGTGEGGPGEGGTGEGGTGEGGTGANPDAPSAAGAASPRRYTVDEALDDPAAFFSTCGRPLYLSGDLLFDLDQHTLQPTARPVLHRMVRLLKEAPDEARILVITGHTDPRGEGPHNEALSLRRAETVAAFVADNGGVRRNTLVVEGKGEREPIVPESAPLQQQRFNRRVEISVRCPGGG